MIANTPIFEASRDPILLIAMEDGHILNANPAAVKVYGYSREELLSKTLFDIRDSTEALVEQMSQADSSGILIEATHRRKDGTLFPVEISSQGANIDGARVLISIIRDITIRKRAEAEAKSIAQFPSENPNPVLRATPEGRALYLNPAAREFMREMRCREALPPNLLHAVRRVITSGLRDETEIYTPEGKWIHFVLSPNNKESYINLYGLDITRRKQAEEDLRESEARFKAISEAAFDGIIIHGDGKIIEINEAFARMYGYDIKELIGKPLLELYAKESHEKILHNVSSGCQEPYEVIANRKNGQIFIAEVRGKNLIYQGKNVRAGTHRDITERRRFEEELKSSREALRQSNEELEEKVKKRSAKLFKTVQKLQKEIVRRHNVEKELRHRAGQLRALAGELTLAEQRERKRLSTILHDHLQQVLAAAKLQVATLQDLNSDTLGESVKEIDALLNDSLQISRNLSAELSPPILYEGGLNAGLEWLSRWMEARYGLKITINSSMERYSLTEDTRILIFESVKELLFNAFKHSGVKEAQVNVANNIEMIVVNVTDKGNGFDPAMLERVEGRGGFGLFSIMQRIELIGGKFSVRSSPDKGTCISISAPLARIDTAVPPSATRSLECGEEYHNETGKIRLLVVDDHPVMREGLARMLSQEADILIVGQANDGVEAVEQAEKLNPNVILMDISMPRLNGVEATKIISKQHPHMKIIGLSLYEAEDRAKEMIDAGAAKYLSKSGPASTVKDAIRICVRG